MTHRTTPWYSGAVLSRIWLIFLAAIISASLTGCTQEDDPYYSPLVGRWQLVDYYGPGSYFLSGLILYEDGFGYVTGEDDYGYPQTWEVQWSSFSGRSLTIYFNDAYGSIWTYYYNFNGGELHLQPVDDISTDYWYIRA